MEKKTIVQLIEAEIEKIVFAEKLTPSSIKLYSDLGKMIITNVAVNYLHEQTKDMTHDACIAPPLGAGGETLETLRKQFADETNVALFNSQGEFDIDYVDWLEKRCLSATPPPKETGKSLEEAAIIYSHDTSNGQVKTSRSKRDFIAGALYASQTQPQWVNPEIKPKLSGYFLVCFEEFGFQGNYQEVCLYYHLSDEWLIPNVDYKGFTIIGYRELPTPPKP